MNLYRTCPDSSYTAPWWVGEQAWRWSTSVNAEAEPYLDDNRFLDPCERNSSMSVGMHRRPLRSRLVGR